MKSLEKKAVTMTGIAVGGLFFILAGMGGAFGVTKSRVVKKFNYQTKEQQVVCDDLNFSPFEKCYILLGKDKIYSATLTADNGEEVRVSRGDYLK